MTEGREGRGQLRDSPANWQNSQASAARHALRSRSNRHGEWRWDWTGHWWTPRQCLPGAQNRLGLTSPTSPANVVRAASASVRRSKEGRPKAACIAATNRSHCTWDRWPEPSALNWRKIYLGRGGGRGKGTSAAAGRGLRQCLAVGRQEKCPSYPLLFHQVA
jgi:hypothetical protein